MIPAAKFYYTNHRGERRRREAILQTFEWLADPGYGYPAGWFWTGLDVEKGLTRSFAVTNMEPLVGYVDDGKPVELVRV